MIFESAFAFLPEILVGNGFLRKEYEASIVNAFSLAVLQSLNARNYPNPLSAIEVEKTYEENGFITTGINSPKRYPRADLFVKSFSAGIASKELSLFGWRHNNWLEAKFYRLNENGKPKIPSTNAILLMTKDIFRLCALIKPQGRQGQKNNRGRIANRSTNIINASRYFLHIYEGRPEDFLGKNQRNKKKIHRQWLINIRKPGIQNIKIDIGSFVGESKNFQKDFPPPLNQLILEAKIQNHLFEQIGKSANNKITCILTRVISFKISMGSYSLSENETRMRSETPPAEGGDKIRNEIGRLMGIGTKSSERDIPVSQDEIMDAEEYESNSLLNVQW